MSFRLSPISLAITSSLLCATHAYADGGAAGAPGQSLNAQNEVITTIGAISSGAPGTADREAEGKSGAELPGQNISNLGGSAAEPLTIRGTDGENGQDGLGGGGAGGQGGGSLIGSISQGGSGGESTRNPNETANGGDGAAVGGNHIRLTHAHLEGAKGGAGGRNQDSSYSGGGGGSGGQGGGSLIGGISEGAAGGYAQLFSWQLLTSSANGGHSGQVSDNTITLQDSTLSGQEGGRGSDIDNGGGGNGGHGGGSVIGGISSGATGGYALATNTSDSPQPKSISTADGGSSGHVSHNTIAIQASSLIGKNGGDGGSSINNSGGGNGGHAGGSVFGGISSGGAAGLSYAESESRASGGFSDDSKAISAESSSNGGNAGMVRGNTITIEDSHALSSQNAGSGGASDLGGSGNGGHGGGSVFGGISSGAAGGYANAYSSSRLFPDSNTASAQANGGNGGQVSSNTITLQTSSLAGENGGIARRIETGGSGHGGHAGGSVFGGISSGAAGGSAYTIAIVQRSSAAILSSSASNGGNSGQVDNNTITIQASSLAGQDGGSGGSGNGGHGGGSVFGGISRAAAAGYAYVESYENESSSIASSNGGNGGQVNNNTITIDASSLTGQNGGSGGSSIGTSASGDGGHGGGSVFGGISSGAAGGHAETLYSTSSSLAAANGGNGGRVNGHKITVTDSSLKGGNGGAGGESKEYEGIAYGAGHHGQAGGSIFGGFSSGGAGGYALIESTYPQNLNGTANGGQGGDVTDNTITIAGKSSLSGSVYGGMSQGGQAGVTAINDVNAAGNTGIGGRAEGNTITLVGDKITIAGSLYGGYSVNGDGSLNHDRINLDNHKAFRGNTLNLEGYRGAVAGVYNFEKYNWLLPKDVVNGDTLIHITGDDKVQLNNTQHTIAMENDGNRLHAGDLVTMIDKAEGAPELLTPQIQQGHFITYDAKFGVEDDALVLRIAGKEDTTPVPAPEPGGRVTPTAKAFLEGRLASLAQINQGADAISGIGLDAARNSVGRCGTNLFMFVDGGSNRYETGSHIKLRNTNVGFGAAHCFELPSQSQVLVGAFVEHGNGNYDSYNQFEGYDEVHGWGKVRYTGAGVLLHMNVAGTGTGKKEEAPSSIARNDGVYLDAAIRAGQAKTRFDSNLVDPEGLIGAYSAKSPYYSVMAGVGYALNLDEKQAVDLYSRYTWSHINSDTVTVGKDELHLGELNSSRLRLGARYSYAATPQVTPYVGLAYEREFSGKSKGSSYGMAIDSPTLKGNTGIAEVGLTVVPNAAKQALSVNFGVQGYFSTRKGGAASLRVRYAF